MDISHLPEWINTLFIVIPLVIAGGFVVIGLTDKKAKEKTKERQDEADAWQARIDKLTKEATAIQDTKIKEQSEQLKALGERLATIEGENRAFRSAINGTDDQSKAYKERVLASLALVDKLAEVIMENGKKTNAIMEIVEQTNKNIEVLAQAIAKKK